MSNTQLSDIVKIKSVSDTANLVRGLIKQMPGSSNSRSGIPIAGTTEIVTVNTDMTTAPKKGRPKKVVEPVRPGAPPSKEQIEANIEQLGEVADATKQLQDKYFQENLAQSSVANQIAVENAPTTIAIKELQSQMSDIAKGKAEAIKARDTEREPAKRAAQEALLGKVEDMIREIAGNTAITDVMREQLLGKLGEMGVTLEDTKNISKANLDKMDDFLDNVGDAIAPVSTKEWSTLHDRFMAMDKAVGESDAAQKIIGKDLWEEVRLMNSKLGERPAEPTTEDAATYHKLMDRLTDVQLTNLMEGNVELRDAFRPLMDPVKPEPVAESSTPSNPAGFQLAEIIRDSKNTGTHKSKVDEVRWHGPAKKKQGQINSMEVKVENDGTFKYKDRSVKLTPGLALLLSDQPLTGPDVKSGKVTQTDLAQYLDIIKASLTDEIDTSKAYKFNKAQKLVMEAANEEADKGTPKKPAKTGKGGGPKLSKKRGMIPNEHHRDMGYVVDWGQKKIKVYPTDKIVDGAGIAGARAAATYDFTPGLNALLTYKSVATKGPNKPTENDWTAFKEIATMMPSLLEKVGRGSSRYSAVYHTAAKVPVPRSKASQEKLLHDVEVNILEITESGNTSEDLKILTRRQISALKTAGLLDDLKKKQLLELIK